MSTRGYILPGRSRLAATRPRWVEPECPTKQQQPQAPSLLYELQTGHRRTCMDGCLRCRVHDHSRGRARQLLNLQPAGSTYSNADMARPSASVQQSVETTQMRRDRIGGTSWTGTRDRLERPPAS